MTTTPSKEARARYEKFRKGLVSGKEDGFNMGLGVHPEGGPFISLMGRNELMRFDGKSFEWVLPAKDAIELLKILMTGLFELEKAMDVTTGSPSKANH